MTSVVDAAETVEAPETTKNRQTSDRYAVTREIKFIIEMSPRRIPDIRTEAASIEFQNPYERYKSSQQMRFGLSGRRSHETLDPGATWTGRPNDQASSRTLPDGC